MLADLVRAAALLEQRRDSGERDRVGDGHVARAHPLHLTRRHREQRRVRRGRGSRVSRLLHVLRQLVHVETARAQQHRPRRRQQRSPEALECAVRGARLRLASPARQRRQSSAQRPDPRRPTSTIGFAVSGGTSGAGTAAGKPARHAGASTSARSCRAADRSAAPSGGLPRRSTARGGAGLLPPSPGRWDRRRCRRRASGQRR